ncbi:MAG TPA: hypothetical protein PK199_08285 [Bacteroidales bacterium]|nr:hypothetical protein [Bacteroidales bacterium]
MHIIFTYNFLKGSNGCKFAFNGQVKDDEIYGEGNAYSAEFWEYDARIGRRWNVDPMSHQFPWQSPYSVFDNDPISKIDTDGLSANKPPTQKQIDRRIAKFENKEKKLAKKTGLSGDALRAEMYLKYAGRKFALIESTTQQGDEKVYEEKNVGNDNNGGQGGYPTGEYVDDKNGNLPVFTQIFQPQITPPTNISMNTDGTFPNTVIALPTLPPGTTSVNVTVTVVNLNTVAGATTITITQAGTPLFVTGTLGAVAGSTLTLPISNNTRSRGPILVSVTNSAPNLTMTANPLGIQGGGAFLAPQVDVRIVQQARQDNSAMRSIYIAPGDTFKKYIKRNNGNPF